MGFIGSAIGGIFKVILSPLTKWIWSLLYGLLIRGPLSILSYLDKVFQYLSGAHVDELLFSTSLSNGHPHLNFFSSASPLKPYFLIMLGVAGALLALFMSVAIVKSFTKKHDGPWQKLPHLVQWYSNYYFDEIPLYKLGIY